MGFCVCKSRRINNLHMSVNEFENKIMLKAKNKSCPRTNNALSSPYFIRIRLKVGSVVPTYEAIYPRLTRWHISGYC